MLSNYHVINIIPKWLRALKGLETDEFIVVYIYTAKKHRARQFNIPCYTDQLFDRFPTRFVTLHLSNRHSQLLSVTEVAPKSPFLCVHRSTIRYGSRSDPKAIQHIVNIARPISFLPLLLASTSSLLKPLIGDFKIRRRDGNENVKKQQVNFISKTTTFHVHHSFLYISLPFLHDYDVKCLIFAFYGKRKQATRKSYFSFCIMNLISLGIQLQEGSSTFEK